MNEDQTLKVCNICKQPKPQSEMKKDSRRVDGLAGQCNTCAAEIVRRSKLKTVYPSSIRDAFIMEAF